MPYNTTLIFRLIIMFGITCQLAGCQKDCGPAWEPLLTGKEKSIIPNRQGDTLHFIDNSGKRYFLVCKNKDLSQSGFSHTGHNNPCHDTDVRWDALAAQFEGNILNDQNQLISLRTKIEGGYQPHDPGNYELSPSCNSNYKCFFYLIFTIPETGTYKPQTFFGKTEESLLPVVLNYDFIHKRVLGGQQFNNLISISSSNKCLGSKASNVGLDSVYYSNEYGLIRLTTIGGKKYQRVL